MAKVSKRFKALVEKVESKQYELTESVAMLK